MTAVATIKPHLTAITCPDALRGLQAWICWRYEHHDGEPKPRKVPYYASGARRHGVQGRPEDRQQLVTFDAAKAAAARRGMDGVGLCLLRDLGIVALDFDRCIDAGGVHPDVERVVAGTYAEYSPSGNGVRAFFKGEGAGNRKSHDGAYGFEVFSTAGFVTFTGNTLPITDLTESGNVVAHLTPEVYALCAARFGRAEATHAGSTDAPPLGLAPEQLQHALETLDPSMGHDPWLRVGMALHHETSGEGFDLWDEWSSRGVQYPGREALERRWDSFGRGSQRPVTVHALVNMANEKGAGIELAAVEAADAFDVLPPVPEAPGEPKHRFPVLPAATFAQGKPPGWLVKDVLPAADLLLLIGESQAGKSFIALDLAAAIARGVEWRGKRVKQGKVVYIAAEGAAGFRNRLKAYAAKNEIALEDLQIGVIHAAPNLLLKDDALDVCKSIIAAGGADLVIVDTFAQVTPGANENAAEDMGKALAHCRGINIAVRAPVLLVHHMGKDASRGARGWSGLKAAADAELEVLRLATGRMLRVSKQKDGEDGLTWGFELDVVPVGADDEGDVITSCVVRECEAPAVHQVRTSTSELGDLGRQIVAVVNEFAQAQTAGIEIEAVVAAVADRMPQPENGKRDTRRQRVRSRLLALIEAEKVPYEVDGDCISIF